MVELSVGSVFVDSTSKWKTRFIINKVSTSTLNIFPHLPTHDAIQLAY